MARGTNFEGARGGDEMAANKGGSDPLNQPDFTKQTEMINYRTFAIPRNDSLRLKKLLPGDVTTYTVNLKNNELNPKEIIKLEGDTTIWAKVISVSTEKNNKSTIEIKLVPPQKETK